MLNLKANMLGPPHMSPYTGTLVSTRKDGKPLHPIHVSAFFGYTAMTLKDPSHPEGACLTVADLHTNRIDQASREGFKRWYAKMWMMRTHHHMGYVPSPFDGAGLEAYKDVHAVNQPGLYL